MQKNVLEYLERTAERVPDKTAFADEDTALTFREFMDRAMRIGTVLAGKELIREPVLVYMKKSPHFLAAFFGVVYSGCFYVPIDEEMPLRRIELILQNTDAKYMICDSSTREAAGSFDFKGEILDYETCCDGEPDSDLLKAIRRKTLDIDPVCVFYTSGSTGIPKGVVVCHRGIIDYVEQLCGVLDFDETSVFANQTPLYWDASMKEIYATLRCGATTWLVPKDLFMFPIKVVEYLNRHEINTINWVVSALTMISAFGTFDTVMPEYLRTVTFCGEVFPVRQFNIWKNALPDVDFYNLYGPTEATGVSTYYHADRVFGEDEVIPIGKPFDNTEVLLLDFADSDPGNDGRDDSEEGMSEKKTAEKESGCQATACEVPDGKEGEICIRSSGVTLGYYGMPEKTEEVFVRNPLQTNFFERIYRTGDMAYRNSEGNLIFTSRKDYQIKHMGHRIELGEIEADVNNVECVRSCCCIYVKEKNKIVLFYVGEISKSDLTKKLKERLPRYMMPNAIRQLESMPLLLNGKMDRGALQKMYATSQGKKK